MAKTSKPSENNELEQLRAENAALREEVSQLKDEMIRLVSRNLDLTERFADTDAYAWLTEHAHEYGFIIRYTKEGVNETGYAFEPWHVRYLGEQATDVWESGLTLEAWYRQKLAGSHLLRTRRFSLFGGIN